MTIAQKLINDMNFARSATLMDVEERFHIIHASDCALHNGPALRPEPCNCNAYDTLAAKDALIRELVEALEKFVGATTHIEQIPLHIFSRANAALARAKQEMDDAD